MCIVPKNSVQHSIRVTMSQRYCFLCNRLSQPRQLGRLNTQTDDFRACAILRRELSGIENVETNDETGICLACRRSVQNELNALAQDPSCLRLNIAIQRGNHGCIICQTTVNTHAIPVESRVDAFIQQNVYIPANARSCRHHYDHRGYFLRPLLVGLPYYNRPYVIRGSELQQFMQAFRTVAVNQNVIDTHTLTDEEFIVMTSITKEQFEDLFAYCDSVYDPDGRKRNIDRRHLLIFLCKMRQGLSDEFLRVIFKFNTRQALSKIVSNVRSSLMLRFVPGNLGLEAITRDQCINLHVTEFANYLYNDAPETQRMIAYIDGTYAPTEKNSNHRILRQTFSMHKKDHLLKPVMLVAPDGYIIDIEGPYYADARNNDSSILNQEFTINEELMNLWFQRGDILILDRGYRDSIPLLESKGIVVKMPALLKRGQKQLTTEEANESRLITKTRWLVEARNGHIKSKFKLLLHRIDTVHLKNLGDFYRIAGALINKYHALLYMEGVNRETAEWMRERANMPNVVQALFDLEPIALNSRSCHIWLTLTSQHVQDFPRLTMDDLKRITVGVYQIGLAPGYIQDKIQRQDEDEFQIEMRSNQTHQPETGFLRVRTFSRFRNSTKYYVWIAYRSTSEPQEEDEEDGVIFGYYCTCISGARTLGTCAHVACILWFLGYARHTENVHFPSTTLLRAIQDAGNRPEPPPIDIFVQPQ